jgi:transcriptional regulator with XRE-family HTH domain
MFNEILKQAMQEKEMNLTALSAATGIGKSSISQYLSGKNEPPEKRKEVIATALGLSVDYFKTAEIQEDISADTPNLPVTTAARLMGKSKEFIYQGLRDGVFPWGYGVKMGKNWSYYISPVMFTKCTGLAIN